MALAEDEETILRRLEEDSRWIKENLEKLRQKLEGMVFAVKEKKVIAKDENILFLLETLEKKGVDAGEILIESIPPRNMSFIL